MKGTCFVAFHRRAHDFLGGCPRLSVSFRQGASWCFACSTKGCSPLFWDTRGSWCPDCEVPLRKLCQPQQAPHQKRHSGRKTHCWNDPFPHVFRENGSPNCWQITPNRRTIIEREREREEEKEGKVCRHYWWCRQPTVDIKANIPSVDGQCPSFDGKIRDQKVKYFTGNYFVVGRWSNNFPGISLFVSGHERAQWRSVIFLPVICKIIIDDDL